MVKVNCESDKGGAVEFGGNRDVWASYAVAGVAGLPRPEIFYAGVKLQCGKNVNIFVNRETGLVTVDVLNERDDDGVEIFREVVK
jgi:hypothetical protein